MAETAREPDALQREIDRTRDELARTIDAIVERMSPKHAARRGVALMKENAAHAREAVTGRLSRDGRHGARPGALRAGAPQEALPPGATVYPPREHGEEPVDIRTTTYRVRDTMRRDRVALLAAGVGLLVVTGAVLAWRRSRG